MGWSKIQDTCAHWPSLEARATSLFESPIEELIGTENEYVDMLQEVRGDFFTLSAPKTEALTLALSCNLTRASSLTYMSQ